MHVLGMCLKHRLGIAHFSHSPAEVGSAWPDEHLARLVRRSVDLRAEGGDAHPLGIAKAASVDLEGWLPCTGALLLNALVRRIVLEGRPYTKRPHFI